MSTTFDDLDDAPSGGYARCPRCKTVFALEHFGYRRRRNPKGLCPVCTDDERDYKFIDESDGPLENV